MKPLIVDWDDTLVSSKDGEWLGGAKEFLVFCRRHGWKVVVASSRANYQKGEQEIRDKLAEARFVDIDVQPKPMGFAYIDNLGVGFDGSWTDVRRKVMQLAKT